jgi:hypothetical protein
MERPRTIAPLIAAMLLVFTMVYVGTYLALVSPQQIIVTKWHRPMSKGAYFTDDDFDLFASHYRHAHELAEKVFLPLEQLDRNLRPAAWKPFRLQDDLARMKEYAGRQDTPAPLFRQFLLNSRRPVRYNQSSAIRSPPNLI